jgi:hypothetical protein
MAMFSQLRMGELPLFKINFGVITLLPKSKMPAVLKNIVLFVFLM